MAYKAQILFGTITKVHGHQGAVTVRLERAFIERIPEMESVFLEIEGKPVPFFISSLEYPGADIAWLKFEDYESIGKAREFTGCRIFLTSGKPVNKKIGELSSPEGYQIITADNQKVGIVTGLVENPGQILLTIDTGSGEILIPFHEDLIIKIDKKKKVITMALPEGLIDLNI